jgi:hypothetical protein
MRVTPLLLLCLVALLAYVGRPVVARAGATIGEELAPLEGTEPEVADSGDLMTSCSVSGIAGSCIAKTSCTGTAVPGFCPGAANIQVRLHSPARRSPGCVSR